MAGNAAHPGVHTTWKATIRTALIATLIVTVVLLAFVWPTKASSVKDLPIDVVGAPAAVSLVSDNLEKSGAFDVHAATSAADAKSRIEKRESYGAVVLPRKLGGDIEVLTASAASPVTAQLLNQVAGQLTKQSASGAATAKTQAGEAAAKAAATAAASAAVVATLGKAPKGNDPNVGKQLSAQIAKAKVKAAADAKAAQAAGAAAQAITVPAVTVTDVVPLVKEDARGTGLGVSGLPLAMGGIIGGILISMLVTGGRRRLVAVLLYAGFGGLALAGVLSAWFGFLPEFWPTAAVMAGSFLATAATIVGLNALLGTPGIPIGAIITMFIGNPLSSANAPLEFLPAPWGAVGQYFVPGASGTLLRLVNYFPEASTSLPIIVLASWSLLGMLLMLTGHFRSQEVVHVEADVEPDHARASEPVPAAR